MKETASLKLPHGYFKSLEKQKSFLEDLQTKLGIKELDGWYSMNGTDLISIGGARLLDIYGGSLSRLLAAVYSEHPWDLSRFSSKPHGYWKSMENQQRFMNELSLKLHLPDLDGWYSVPLKKISSAGGGTLLNVYGGSLFRLLSTVFPNHSWDSSKFAPNPQKYLKSLENQKEYMEKLGKKLGVTKLDGWYSVNSHTLLSHGAGKILDIYGGSLSKLVTAIYPKHNWNISNFISKNPPGYWTAMENQRRFMDDLGDKIGVKVLDDWYSKSTNELIANRAGALLGIYGNSLSKLLTAVYPNHSWEISKFSKKPQNYWQSLENQKRFMDELGQKIGVSSEEELEKWYGYTYELLDQNGGRGLSARYKNLPELLATIYPNFSWQLWRFAGQLRNALQNESEFEKLFSYLEKALDIRQPEDWYRVTTDQLTALKVSSFSKSTEGGLVELLARRYPTVKWDAESFFGRGYRRATQRWLAVMLGDLFPSETILYDHFHRGGGEVVFQLDVYIPELRLAFEYQGAQHYEQLPVYGELDDRVARDVDKAKMCQAQGVTLIAVPYWWNKKRPALLAAILAERPDLFDTGRLAPFLEEARR